MPTMTELVKSLLVTIAVALVLPLNAADAASRGAKELLQYVPADTPYVLASTEPLPDKLADKFEPTVDEVLLAYQRIIRYSMSEELVKLSAEEDGAEKAEQLQGVVDEVLGLMSVQGIRDAGISRDDGFVFFGNGLLPVLRVELSDPAAFSRTIARVEDKVGQKLSVGEVKGETYRYFDLEKIHLIIATLDDQAVVTALPPEFDEQQLAVALGIKKPRKSLAKSKELRAIAKEHGFSDYFTGFVNNERIASAFIGEPQGLNQDLLDLLEYDASELSPTCKTEFMGLAGIAPRMVFGYQTMNDRYLESELVVEMRKDIASGLATLPAPVPGLGQDHGGLVSFGLSLNPLALRQFYEARLDAMEADPYECDKLAAMQIGVAAGREVLNKPVPPVVYGFRGFLAIVDDIQGMDFASEQPPESVDGSFLFAIENAQDLVTMAAMMDPQIAALNLLPDGNPVKLEMAQLAEVAEEAFAALSESAMSVAVGEGAENKAARLLDAEIAEPAPLFSMSMDTARYYGFIGDAMMMADPDEGEEEMPLAVRSALRDVMTLMGSLYKRMRLDVTLTDTGVVMSSRLTLAD